MAMKWIKLKTETIHFPIFLFFSGNVVRSRCRVRNMPSFFSLFSFSSSPFHKICFFNFLFSIDRKGKHFHACTPKNTISDICWRCHCNSKLQPFAVRIISNKHVPHFLHTVNGYDEFIAVTTANWYRISIVWRTNVTLCIEEIKLMKRLTG